MKQYSTTELGEFFARINDAQYNALRVKVLNERPVSPIADQGGLWRSLPAPSMGEQYAELGERTE